MFDLYKDNRDAALAFLSNNISPGKPLSFGESVEAAWTANGAYQMSVSKENTRNEIIDGIISRYREATGEDLTQLDALSPEEARQRIEKARISRPDLNIMAFPDPETIEAMTIEKMRAARVHYDALQARGGSGLGDFIGTAASTLRDPINMASLAFGASAASGVLRTALIEGGINMGSQAAVVASTYETRRKINPNYTFDQAMYEVAAAGVGGAVIGGGLKGLVKLFEGVDRATLPREVNDALNVAGADAKTAESNPFPGSAPTAAQHKEVLDTIAHKLQTSDEPFTPPVLDVPEMRGVPEGPSLRDTGIPVDRENHLFTGNTDQVIKAHPDYVAAKAGDQTAAVNLISDVVSEGSIAAARERFGAGAIYAPVIAEEATGRNAIPNALATRYADEAGGTIDTGIVQNNRAYHTGAGPMERVANRATFDGPVVPGGRYVIVDDVTVMGSTLADMANHIQKGGGNVVGVVTLANASRTGVLMATKADIAKISGRFGNAIEDLFAIKPGALTADEARYLLNFRDADALRSAAASAARKRTDRLNERGVRSASSGETVTGVPAGSSALSEQAIREAAAAPEAAQAANKLAQDLADKAADEGRVAMTHLSDDSKPVPLTQVLKEADDEEALAAEIGACAIGQAVEVAP